MWITCLFLWSGAMLALARWICGRWFNHLSLYTAVWTTSIFAYCLGLIQYHHVVFEAWAYVFIAWFALYLWTAAVRLGAKTVHNKHWRVKPFPQLNLELLRWAIIFLGSAGIASS